MRGSVNYLIGIHSCSISCQPGLKMSTKEAFKNVSFSTIALKGIPHCVVVNQTRKLCCSLLNEYEIKLCPLQGKIEVVLDISLNCQTPPPYKPRGIKDVTDFESTFESSQIPLLFHKSACVYGIRISLLTVADWISADSLSLIVKLKCVCKLYNIVVFRRNLLQSNFLKCFFKVN